MRRETPDPIPTSICEKRFLPYVLRIFGRRGWQPGPKVFNNFDFIPHAHSRCLSLNIRKNESQTAQNLRVPSALKEKEEGTSSGADKRGTGGSENVGLSNANKNPMPRKPASAYEEYYFLNEWAV